MLPLAVMINVAVPAFTEVTTSPEYLQLTKLNVAELEALGTKTPALLKLASVVATRFGFVFRFGIAEGAAASPPPQAASKTAALRVSRVLKEVFIIFSPFSR